MFRPYTLGAAILAASAMIACKSNNNNANAGESAAAMGPALPDTSAAATATTTPDTTAAANDSATGATPGAMSDANILAKQTAGDSAEVAIASYMQSNTKNARVKAYADLLQRDHAKGMSQVEALEKKLSMTPQLPSNDTTAQETSHTIDHLKSLNGMDRDTAFVNHEIADHQADIADAKQQEQAAQDPQVKALVRKAVPELQRHLDRGQQLAKTLGGAKA